MSFCGLLLFIILLWEYLILFLFRLWTVQEYCLHFYLKDTILKLSVYQEGSKACFEFENESPYITEDMQKAIFAQYVSYASTHNELGIGLGLYASKKIIEAHAGKIFVRSSKDEHNRFGFKIPVKHKNSSEPIEICF